MRIAYLVGVAPDLSFAAANAYVWHGVTMADQSVLQADISLSAPLLGGSVTGGVWANQEIDPSASRFSTLTGNHGGIGEADFYAQLARPLGAATVTLGATALRFPEIDEWNTYEVFGSVGFPGAPLAPSLLVRKDVDAVGGAYAELNLAQGVTLGSRTFTLAGVAGASTGQAEDGDLAWYSDEGITHLGLNASTGIEARGMTITPLVGMVYGVDDFAKVDGDAARFVASLTLSRSLRLHR